jgi:hypothetical protein
MRAWGAAVSAGHVLLALLGWLLLGVAPWFFGGCAVVTLGDDGGAGTGPDDPEPTWWPGFERDFRAYDEARRRARA